MRRAVAAAAVLAAATVAGAEESVLVAGLDVAAPERVHYVQPQYPAIAQMADVKGVVLVDILLDVTGRPKKISVVRPVPLLDLAAIECARQWRFAQTMVDGVPRQVRLVGAVEFFVNAKDAVRGYGEIAEGQKESTLARVFAIQQLGALAKSGKPKDVKDVPRLLDKLRQNSVPEVAKAAEAAAGAPPTQ